MAVYYAARFATYQNAMHKNAACQRPYALLAKTPRRKGSSIGFMKIGRAVALYRNKKKPSSMWEEVAGGLSGDENYPVGDYSAENSGEKFEELSESGLEGLVSEK